MATAPKSNASYMALGEAQRDVKEVAHSGSKHLRDASYHGAKRLGHGSGYEYAHNSPKGMSIRIILGLIKPTTFQPNAATRCRSPNISLG